MDTEWGKLLEGQNATFEIRLKKLFQGEEVVGGKQVAGPTWIIASAYPERAPDGTISKYFPRVEIFNVSIPMAYIFSWTSTELI